MLSEILMCVYFVSTRKGDSRRYMARLDAKEGIFFIFRRDVAFEASGQEFRLF
jgi:hypothetical protein